MTDKERLFTRCKVDVKTGCWIWQGSKDNQGYGRMQYKGKVRITHRISMAEHCDFDIDSKLDVCHHCDTPSCANPEHLFAGTASENILDSVRKERWSKNRRGEKHGRSTITEKEVLRMRKLYSKGERIADIARLFPHATYFAVQDACTRRSWKYLL